MKRYLLIYMALMAYGAIGQTSSRNFVRQTVHKVAGGANLSNPNQAQSTITYFDGLGQSTQTVDVHAGGAGQDLVQLTEYDDYGRAVKQYLPLPVNGGKGDYNTGVATATATYYGAGNRAYSQTVYEPMPSSRVLKVAGPGDESLWSLNSSPWNRADGTTRSIYTFNTANTIHEIRVSQSSFEAGSLAKGITRAGYYGKNQLTVTETIQEGNKSETLNKNRVREYKDKYGRVVLKSVINSDNEVANTYYVYDDYGQLRAVLPPELSAVITGLTEANLTEAAFLYCYDDQGRLVYKKVPGAGYVKMDYDANDRLIYLQDANQRAKNQYISIEYDGLNRETRRMLVTNGTSKDLSINYYDTYDVSWFTGITTKNPYSQISASSKTGLLTGKKSFLIDDNGVSSSGQYTLEAYFYDIKGRVVETYRRCPSLTGGIEENICKKLAYHGRVDEEVVIQSNSIVTTKVTQSFQYDHRDRLVSTCHRIEESKVGESKREELPHLLQVLSYDDLGRLKTKKLGRLPEKAIQKDSTLEFASVVNYAYNTRNWLTSQTMHRLVKKADYNNVSTMPAYFSLDLGYEGNGNITKYDWSNNGAKRGYVLAYDGMNRLLQSIGTNTDTDLSESLSYRLDGSIKTLKRWNGPLGGTSRDDLAYSYASNLSVQLTSVLDNTNDSKGYNDVNKTMTDFSYDANGNLVVDKDKGITNINYNLLNLVNKVSFADKQVNYYYDGSGTKWSYANSGPGGINKIYIGGSEYVNQGTITLNRIFTSEGHVQLREGWTPNSPLSKYIYLYDIKDHLGNVRLVHDDSEQAKIYQGNYYSAFGVSILSLGDNMTATQTVLSNDRLYNGKELQDGTNWLDYGARMYYPELGRWMAVDPSHEDGGQESWSTYQYVFNNPVRNTDPDGRACCGEFLEFTQGMAKAMFDDMTPATLPERERNNTAYRNGTAVGHIVSAVVGIGEIVGGAGLEVVAVAAEAVSLGGLTIPAVAVGTAGVGMMAHWAHVYDNSIRNLNTSGKHPNSNSTSGNNTAAQIGKRKHKELSEKVSKKDGWKSEPSMIGKDGKKYKPDVITPSGNILEYKPNTPRGRSR
jgi:RHS repeat-associated protein